MCDQESKEEVWATWVRQTILADIQSAETPDPVRMVDDTGSKLTMTDEYDSYRLGRGSGDYLYMLYLLDESVKGPFNIIPVYIGETGNIASRVGYSRTWSRRFVSGSTAAYSQYRSELS